MRGMQQPSCACSTPLIAGWNARLCARCDGYVMAPVRPPPVRIARVPGATAAAARIALEWRNDHGASCTCLACVMQRSPV